MTSVSSHGFAPRVSAPGRGWLVLLLGAALAASGCGSSSGSGGGGSTTPPAVASVVVVPATASVAVGATTQLGATAKDASGNAVTGVTFTWSSSAPAVASVDSTGKVSGVATGTANITAADGSITSPAAVVTVTAPAPAVASITLAPTSVTIDTGATQQFTATVKDAGGNTLTGVSLTWTSSATAVATVDGTGKATGVTAGNATITAASGTVTSPAAALTVLQAGAVTGTAASGAAIASAAVTLKDASGTVRTSNTGADGSFTVDTSGLTPPFLVMVQPATGNPLYSVSADANATTTINVDTLTDQIIRAWYGAQGSTVDAGFSSPASQPAPTAPQVQLISHVFLQATQLWLTNNGLDPTTFDLIATPFAANSTGFDKVLDETTVNATTGALTITDGTTTQTASVVYATSNDSVTVNSSTTSGSATSVSSVSTVVPAQTASAAALAGINATLAALGQTLASKGTQLAATDLSPYIASDLIQDGLNATLWADQAVTSLRGTSGTLAVTALNSLDSTGGIANVNFTFTATENGAAVTQEQDDTSFKLEGGQWLWYGNQRPGSLDLESEMRVNEGAQSSSGPDINLDFQSPQGVVTGVTVSGGGIWNDSAFQLGAQVDETYAPTPDTTVDTHLDHYYLNSNFLSTLVPAGTIFTFVVTPASGSPVTLTVPSNSFTTEAVSISGVTDSSLAAVPFGQPLTYNWNLPKTFAVSEIHLDAIVFTGNQSDPSTESCSTNNQPLATTATSGSVTVPATCDGLPVTQVNLNLSITGVGGEHEQVIVFYM